jgi:uncharacterized membrane protein YoaT (DUF817 family)
MSSEERRELRAEGRGRTGFSFWPHWLEFLRLSLQASIFACAVFALLAVSRVVGGWGVPRYDFLLISCLLVQYAMWRFRLETLEEIKFITIFHLFGFVLEQFKTHVGSWAYPEFAYTKIAGVPLYSGFMYAAVGSFIAQAWRLMRFKLEREPNPTLGWVLGLIIYANFFTNAVLPDIRWPLMLAVIVLYWRTRVRMMILEHEHRLPLPIGFGVIGFFIWIAENIATYFGAWVYPHQKDGWQIVDFSKITSWMLLVIISFILVAQLKRGRES